MPHLAFVVFTYSPHSGTLPPHGVPPASPHESGQIFLSKYFLIPQNIFPRTYDGRGAWGAPGVVFVDVVLGARLGRPVDRPLLGLVDGRLLRDERKGYMIQINLKLTLYMRKQSETISTNTNLAEAAEVHLHPAADMVAGGAADGAALLVPVARLGVITPWQVI